MNFSDTCDPWKVMVPEPSQNLLNKLLVRQDWSFSKIIECLSLTTNMKLLTRVRRVYFCTNLSEVFDLVEERVAQIETQLDFLFSQTAVGPEQHGFQLQVVGFPVTITGSINK